MKRVPIRYIKGIPSKMNSYFLAWKYSVETHLDDQTIIDVKWSWEQDMVALLLDEPQVNEIERRWKEGYETRGDIRRVHKQGSREDD